MVSGKRSPTEFTKLLAVVPRSEGWKPDWPVWSAELALLPFVQLSARLLPAQSGKIQASTIGPKLDPQQWLVQEPRNIGAFDQYKGSFGQLGCQRRAGLRGEISREGYDKRVRPYPCLLERNNEDGVDVRMRCLRGVGDEELGKRCTRQARVARRVDGKQEGIECGPELTFGDQRVCLRQRTDPWPCRRTSFGFRQSIAPRQRLSPPPFGAIVMRQA